MLERGNWLRGSIRIRACRQWPRRNSEILVEGSREIEGRIRSTQQTSYSVKARLAIGVWAEAHDSFFCRLLATLFFLKERGSQTPLAHYGVLVDGIKKDGCTAGDGLDGSILLPWLPQDPFWERDFASEVMSLGNADGHFQIQCLLQSIPCLLQSGNFCLLCPPSFLVPGGKFLDSFMTLACKIGVRTKHTERLACF
jgi:hypothetical protein